MAPHLTDGTLGGVGVQRATIQMTSIFLSHNSRDKWFVRELAGRLADSGVTVWLDEVELKIGDSLADRISEAIRDVDFIGVVISKNSILSSWVRKELSLAMSKEIDRESVTVLPIRLDDSEVPEVLRDKLYADFRDPGDFEAQCERILEALGVSPKRDRYANGIAVEWTEEGPRIFGRDILLTATESSALLDRWMDHFDNFLESERNRLGADDPTALPKANILAVLSACGDIYNRVPGEEELGELSTELAKKLNLFWLFTEAMHFEAFGYGEYQR